MQIDWHIVVRLFLQEKSRYTLFAQNFLSEKLDHFTNEIYFLASYSDLSLSGSILQKNYMYLRLNSFEQKSGHM